MANIYTDTNVLRYLGIAFAKTSLPEDIRNRMVLAPLTLLELASQLGTGGAEEAFAALRILRRTHDAKSAGMWLLPWPDDFFRALFNLPPDEDKITAALTSLVLNIWSAAKAVDLKEDGKEARNLWDETTEGLARVFSEAVDVLRSKGSPPKAEHKRDLCRGIAHRSRIDETKIDVDLLAVSLDAYYIFNNHLFQVALQNKNYNFNKNRNDHIDAELLIYLADPRLHLLTGDQDFRRVTGSSQASRVHIASQACIKDPECVTRELRNILETAAAAA